MLLVTPTLVLLPSTTPKGQFFCSVLCRAPILSHRGWAHWLSNLYVANINPKLWRVWLWRNNFMTEEKCNLEKIITGTSLGSTTLWALHRTELTYWHISGSIIDVSFSFLSTGSSSELYSRSCLQYSTMSLGHFKTFASKLIIPSCILKCRLCQL